MQMAAASLCSAEHWQHRHWVPIAYCDKFTPECTIRGNKNMSSAPAAKRRRHFTGPSLATLCLLLGGLLAFAPPVPAETVYKWVDEKGTVHFGERPPEGVEATAVNVSPKSAGLVPERTPDTTQDQQPSVAQQQRDERSEKAQAMQQEAELMAAACEAQRSQLMRLEPRTRVLVRDPDGSTRMLDDDERLKAIDEARTFIEENCE